MDPSIRPEPGRVFGCRLSWTALVTGSLVTLASAGILFLIGCAITFIAGSRYEWHDMTVTLGCLIVASVVVGSIVGGLFSGWLAGGTERTGGFHGALTWCVSFLATLVLAAALFQPVARALGADEALYRSDDALHYLGGIVAAFWATWALALVLSIAAAGFGARRALTGEWPWSRILPRQLTAWRARPRRHASPLGYPRTATDPSGPPSMMDPHHA